MRTTARAASATRASAGRSGAANGRALGCHRRRRRRLGVRRSRGLCTRGNHGGQHPAVCTGCHPRSNGKTFAGYPANDATFPSSASSVFISGHAERGTPVVLMSDLVGLVHHDDEEALRARRRRRHAADRVAPGGYAGLSRFDLLVACESAPRKALSTASQVEPQRRSFDPGQRLSRSVHAAALDAGGKGSRRAPAGLATPATFDRRRSWWECCIRNEGVAQ